MSATDEIDRFLAADGRARKKLLKELLPGLDREGARRLAPVIRDPSPRVAARVTALLARHGLKEEFEKQLTDLKAGKVQLLKAQFNRISGSNV